MLEKRDLQLVRLACRRRWLTAEQGEDCLFLRRKFGAKLSLEEIIRRRGYLDPARLAELTRDADQLVGRRGRQRGAPPSTRPSPAPARLSSSVRAPRDTRETPAARSPSARPAPTEAPAPRAPPRDATLFDAAPPAALLVAAALKRPPEPLAERTIVGPLPDEVAALLEARRAAQVVPPPEEPWGPEDSSEPEARRERSDRSRVGPASPGPGPEDSSEPEARWERSDRSRVGPSPGPGPEDSSEPEARWERSDRSRVGPASPGPGPEDLAAVEPLPSEALLEPFPDEEATGDLLRPRLPSGPPAARGAPILALDDARTLFDMPAVVLAEPRGVTPPLGIVEPKSLGIPEDDAEPTPAAVPAFQHPAYRAPAFEGLARAARAVSAAAEAPEEPTVDAYPVRSLVRDEAAAEALLGPFGPYLLERVVARGERTVVYQAVPAEGGDPVALKVFDGAPDDAARFLAARSEELLAAARVASPRVVRLLDVGRARDRYFVALEQVEGWTLAELLEAGERPSLAESLRIGRDLAEALAAIAAEGIVHGDVRPERVFLESDGGARLAGLGLGEEWSFGGLRVRGVPGFVAPERTVEEAPGPASDLYGLGATLFLLLTGRLPFPGADPGERLTRAMAEPAPDPRTLVPELPGPVAELVSALLERRPEARPQDAQAVAEALEILRAGLSALPQPELSGPALGVARVALRAASLAAPSAALALLVAWVSAPALGLGALEVASGGAAASLVAAALFGALALIRLGELPLPLSAAWLVRLTEAAAGAGALAALSGLVLAPAGGLNVSAAVLASAVWGSLLFGWLLRRRVAASRPDRGVGRILAVLGDPRLARWRALHAPLLTALAALALTRFGLLAYFGAGG